MTQDGQMTTQDWLILYETGKTNLQFQQQYPAAWEVAKSVHDHYTHEDSDMYIPSVVVGVGGFIVICLILKKLKVI